MAHVAEVQGGMSKMVILESRGLENNAKRI